MEEEVMNQEMPERQGMMGANVQPAPMQEEAPRVQSQLVEVLGDRVENNLQNLSEQERGLITQLNIPQFRDFMSKVLVLSLVLLWKQEYHNRLKHHNQFHHKVKALHQ